MRTRFRSKSLKGRDHKEDLSIDRRTILKCVKETGSDGMDGIHMDHDREERQALVNTGMNTLVPRKA
jgi:hypothetical protein